MDFLWQPVLKLPHVCAHRRAGACAMGEDEIRNPHFAGEILSCDRAIAALGQRKIRHRSIDGSSGFRSTSRKKRPEKKYRQKLHAGRRVMAIAEPNMMAPKTIVTTIDKAKP